MTETKAQKIIDDAIGAHGGDFVLVNLFDFWNFEKFRLEKFLRITPERPLEPIGNVTLGDLKSKGKDDNIGNVPFINLVRMIDKGVVFSREGGFPLKQFVSVEESKNKYDEFVVSYKDEILERKKKLKFIMLGYTGANFPNISTSIKSRSQK